jgi:hypothetical protein
MTGEGTRAKLPLMGPILGFGNPAHEKHLPALIPAKLERMVGDKGFEPLTSRV